MATLFTMPTPEEVRREARRESSEQARLFAGGGPAYAAAQSGSLFAEGIARAMGGVLPEEEKAMRFQRMQQDVMADLGEEDITTPEGFFKMAQLTANKAREYGLPEVAQQASLQALSVRDQLKPDQRKVVNVTKLDNGSVLTTYSDGTQDIKEYSGGKQDVSDDLFAKINPKDYTPESVKKFQSTKNYSDLVAIKDDTGFGNTNSPKYMKARKDHAIDLKELRMANDGSNNAINKIDFLLDKENKDGFESLFGGYSALVTQNLPTEKTQNAKAKLNSLKADMKRMGLDLIRSGGSIGQMTEREWPIVQDMIDSLDPKMGEKQAQDVLSEIKARLQRMKSISKEAYDNTWSGTEFHKEIKEDDKPPKYILKPGEKIMKNKEGKRFLVKDGKVVRALADGE